MFPAILALLGCVRTPALHLDVPEGGVIKDLLDACRIGGHRSHRKWLGLGVDVRGLAVDGEMAPKLGKKLS